MDMTDNVPTSEELNSQFPSSYQSAEEQVIDVPSSPDTTSDDEDVRYFSKSSIDSSRTVAIFDWDDTICPSTHLASLGLRVDDISQLEQGLRSQLEELERAVIDILKQALNYGSVAIITNAEEGWVELSGRRFLPRVVRFIEESGIRVLSARTMFEEDFPGSPSNWKAAAFSVEVEGYFREALGMGMEEVEEDLNLLALGDSMSERDAAHSFGMQWPLTKIKTVKFVERPSIDQLLRQVELVRLSYHDLWKYEKGFDVNLTLSTRTAKETTTSRTTETCSSKLPAVATSSQ